MLVIMITGIMIMIIIIIVIIIIVGMCPVGRRRPAFFERWSEACAAKSLRRNTM